ncbi:unnamed protein product, partial [Acanthoscelides obtectus]
LNELEGLSRGTRPTTATPTETGGTKRQSPDPQHVLKVAQFAKEALDFLKTRHSTVKCITTKGAVLPSTNFYTEDDAQWSADFRNDDKILTTCLLLGKNRHESAQEDLPMYNHATPARSEQNSLFAKIQGVSFTIQHLTLVTHHTQFYFR